MSRSLGGCCYGCKDASSFRGSPALSRARTCLPAGRPRSPSDLTITWSGGREKKARSRRNPKGAGVLRAHTSSLVVGGTARSVVAPGIDSSSFPGLSPQDPCAQPDVAIGARSGGRFGSCVLHLGMVGRPASCEAPEEDDTEGLLRLACACQSTHRHDAGFDRMTAGTRDCRRR